MKVLLMGPPASGKGTIGELISEELNIPIFSIGQILRDVSEDSPYYEKIHKQMDEGGLVHPPLVAELLKEEVSKEAYEGGYILDGWMRNIEQKDYFDPKPDFVIFFDISDETAIKRISGRRFCPEDDFSCNIYTLPPENKDHCDKCGGKLTQRDDDRKEVVQNRLELYKEETIPVIEHYKEKGNLVEVDGEPSPKEVLAEVFEKLEKRYDFNKNT